MSCEGRISRRQTYPVDHGNGDKVNNPSQTLLVERGPLTKLRVFVPSLKRHPDCGSSYLARNRVGAYGEEGVLLTPQTILPLTQLFCTLSGKVGGGGTSKEALRRAKRKARLAK